jgi:hypothetical protein
MEPPVGDPCHTCRYFQRSIAHHGECHRFPPVLANPSATRGTWPTVKEDGWCGEHERRPSTDRRTIVNTPNIGGGDPARAKVFADAAARSGGDRGR